MELDNATWDRIRGIFRDDFISSFHFSIATVNPDGSPHVTDPGCLERLDKHFSHREKI